MDFIEKAKRVMSIYNPAICNVQAEGIDASINLKSGQIMLGVGDISNGEGIYTMSISHVYNGDVTTDKVYGEIHTHMGIGFKLNIQQYLIKKNEEFIYLDAEGGTHNIEENNGVYYDTSGLGLIMTEEGSRRILSDSQGNQLIFDGYGQLIKTKGVFGDEIEYIYEGDKLIKMRHALDKSRSFSFAYNGDTLSGIRCDMTRREIIFDYTEEEEGKFLSNISIRNKGQTEKIYAFSYSNKMMNYVIFRSNNKILNIKYNGENKVKEINEALINDIWSRNFEYLDNQTEVTDEKGRKLQYSYKDDGEIYSIVEINKNNVITPIYPQVNTLGTKFFKYANESDRNIFNSYNIQFLQRDSISRELKLELDYNKEKDKISEINAMQLATLTFSGWIKIDTICDAWLVALYRKDETSEAREMEVKIDTALNGWQ